MAKVLEALTKINADTERLNQRIDTIEKTPPPRRIPQRRGAHGQAMSQSNWRNSEITKFVVGGNFVITMAD